MRQKLPLCVDRVASWKSKLLEKYPPLIHASHTALRYIAQNYTLTIKRCSKILTVISYVNVIFPNQTFLRMILISSVSTAIIFRLFELRTFYKSYYFGILKYYIVIRMMVIITAINRHYLFFFRVEAWPRGSPYSCRRRFDD